MLFSCAMQTVCLNAQESVSVVNEPQAAHSPAPTPLEAAAEPFVLPLGLPSVPWPADNPYSSKKAALGKLLYFDKRLSSDGTVSCASCHVPEYAYTDGKALSVGINGHLGTRNAPTVVNAAYQSHLFWDGRAASLEEQCLGPLANPKEMTDDRDVHLAHRNCHERILAIPGYRLLFFEAFGSETFSMKEVAQAMATFERTLLSGNAPFDRYRAGDHSSMSILQIQGLAVFERVGCANCHGGFNFTDGRFVNIGVGMDKEHPDLGRYEISKEERDRGAFKIPTLREVAHTAPYMHDGSLKTLAEVVEYYNSGGTSNSHLSPLMQPLKLSDEDKKALMCFMEALSGEGWQHLQPPEQLP
jgi:cytochrome c peroxidase